MPGNEAQELALQIRAEYLAMSACDATVGITADYGQRVYEYKISVSWQKNGESVLTVLEPETIAGITVRIDHETGHLEYDTVSIETGALTSNGMSPVEAVPMMFDQICSGYMAECALETVGEDRQLWFLCRDPENTPGTGLESAFWFDAHTHMLKRAELISDGYTVIQCEFLDFSKD